MRPTIRTPRTGLAMSALLGTAALAATPALAQSTGQNTTSIQAELVLGGQDNIWDMAFLDDGTMLFTEQCHGLSARMPDGDVTELLGMGASGEDVSAYATVADDLFCDGQAGMNGVAVDPDFDDNRRIYVFSASEISDPPTNRVMRLTLSEDFSNVSERTDIIESIPYKTEATDHPFGDTGTHNGGRIRFGPEGDLWVTTGDNHTPELPQSPTELGSKVLRIDTDGNAAEGNDPPEGVDPRTYTYGHRNTQAITFHPQTGAALIGEHGPWHSDEIMVLENGGNSGWDPRPNMAGRGDCPDNYCGYEPNQMDGMNRFERAAYMPMTDFDTYPDAIEPIWNNNGWSQGISSMAFLKGEQWGDWENHLVVSYMGIGFGGTPMGQRIDVMDLNVGEDGAISVRNVTEMTLPMRPGRFRALVQGPDGSLYVAISQGEVHRFTPG